MAEVLIIAGAQRSGRSARIDSLMREQWGRAMLLTPTRQFASRRLERLLTEGGLSGAWGRPVLTMDDFVAALLRAEGRRPFRLGDLERRILLERIISRMEAGGTLEALGSAVRTNGFTTHILRTITQLKQAAIEPAIFAERVRQRKHPSPLDAVVASVYVEYQRMLLDTGSYDLPGLFWEANLVAQTGRPAFLEDIETLLLDGFDDFTPSEFRLLASIEPYLARLVFGMNYDDDPGRRDLFALPHRTVGTIQAQFTVRTEIFHEADPRTCAEFASRHFMYRGRPVPPADLSPDVVLWTCLDFSLEMETLARSVKKLLIDGVEPERIAIVYPNLSEAAPGLRAIFGEFGVPLRIIQPPSLWSSALVGFLLTLFESLETWSRAAVLDVIISPWFFGECTESGTFTRLAAQAGIVSGRTEWINAVERLKTRLNADNDGIGKALPDVLPNAANSLEALHERLLALDRIAESASDSKTEAAWAAWLDDLIDELDIPARAALHPVPVIRDHERAALAALRELLGRWAVWTADDPTLSTREEFAAALRHAVQRASFMSPGASHGVAALDLPSLRGLEFDHVFLAGANEGDLPSPPPANAIYSEADLSDLEQAGIALEGRRTHAEREARLFHNVLDAARKQLILSWRLYSREGREQFPSPYVAELRELLGNTFGQPVVYDRIAPKLDEIASWRDVCNAASEGCKALKPIVESRFPFIETAMRIERVRNDKSPFGFYDGVVDRPDIADRYGPNHVFSVKQLETYADCPFRFFVEYILNVEETELPEAEFDPRVRGLIMHRALELLHRRYHGLSVLEWPQKETSEAVRAAVDEAFDRFAVRSAATTRGVINAERQRFLLLLDRYLCIEIEKKDKEWKPSHFEVAFGDVRDSSDDLGKKEPYRLPLDNDTAILLRGRIDRIDLLGNDTARIIDYKTSMPSPDFKTGRSMQLAVYAMALEELLMPGRICREALFLAPGKADRKEALGRTIKTDEWPERRAAVINQIMKCLEGIRAGRFPPTTADRDKICAHCAARRVCRFDENRIKRKEAAAP